jgi:UDP-N-acetylmuramoyl-tripeptide--D-alanyl-D-alanine ligase
MAVQTEEHGFSREFRVPLLGRHQAINALLAAAVAAELGLNPDEVQRGFDRCVPARMRLQLWKIGEVQFLDDSYNANADSMRAALNTLSEFPCSGHRVAVLGDMAELGASAEEAHGEIGRYAAQCGVERLVAVGRWAPVMAEAARQAGLSSVEQFERVEQAAEALRRELGRGDVVLLKGSRATAVERIGLILRGGGPGAAIHVPETRPNSLGNQ